ncbi:MAG: hypothetical protein Q9220_006381 [cf. Caloplaca sp. 1 TL-2023]
MPSFFTDKSRRHSRQPSTPQKPISNAPAVVLSTSPTENKKTSNASKAHLRPARRQEAKPSNHSTSKGSPREEQASKRKLPEHVDVFAYMDDDEEEETHHASMDEQADDHNGQFPEANTSTSSPVSAHHSSSHYSDLEVNAEQQSKRQTWHSGFDQAGSFHSDSGISMGSSSGDGDSPILQHKYPSIRRSPRFSTSSHEPPIPEHNGFAVSPEPFTVQCPAFGADVWPQSNTIPADTPEAYYSRVPCEAPRDLDSTSFQLPVTPPELSPQLPQGRRQQSKRPVPSVDRYAHLASTISSQDDAVLKSIYRKFDMLNNRILLYLQDEISELEKELQELDAATMQGQMQASETNGRILGLAESKLPVQMQKRRAELMTRCASKVNTYNQALSSYSNLTKTLSPTSRADIKTYRKWNAKHVTTGDSDISFLKHQHDLITIPQRPQHSGPLILEYSPVTVALTILTTIIVFKFVPQFFARLVMSAVIGLALMCLISPASLLDLQLLKEKRRGVGV